MSNFLPKRFTTTDRPSMATVKGFTGPQQHSVPTTSGVSNVYSAADPGKTPEVINNNGK
jgi:hypothetical protein